MSDHFQNNSPINTDFNHDGSKNNSFLKKQRLDMPTEPQQNEPSVKEDPQDIYSPKNDITTISNGEIGDCLLSD